ncbi:uncharacterized protein BDR25DRAFT_277464 [Lindgomyces ingoldianus]|uniref:Uncharacterized protein n=1 Tax=Lindgomyces ingoldianus TaxID=673940 RepID=A0ACB6RB66_9PLEO|nr:uncharacterized protein BDR25DRAFT_277464 [Lindgomyces ingoldianus]KAF2476381.1 hypothetical protein BDR25DRAFT_277464 [Lindgomyces ingoldianus]
MNDAGSSWSGAEPYDPMSASADHDFGSLIDFDTLDLDFPIDYTNGASDHDTSQQLADLADSLDVQHLQNHFSPAVSQDHRDGGAAMSSQQQQQQQSAMGGNEMPQSENSFFDFNMPQYTQGNVPPFSAAPDQIFRPHSGVPPTPNSVEIHANAARYLQQMDPQQALFDQRYQIRKEDAAFTPLVSPAVTPHDARFQIPDFTTVPGAYFSPLTSPALNAQQHQQHQQQTHSHASQYNTSGSSAATSPVDVDIDMLGEAAIPEPEPSRRLRSNKRHPPSRVRQSPIVKPSRRKGTLSSTVHPKEVSDLLEEAQRLNSARAPSSRHPVPRSCDSSGTESISPEPLSEMGPPPKPSSVTHSPAIVAKGNQSATPSQRACPATPASLMRLQQSPNIVAPQEMPPLEELTLPEAASADRPPLSCIDTITQEDDQPTPRIPARKTPKLGPLSTPSATAALSGKPSPMLSAISSPTSPGFALGTGRRADSKVGRTSKKRNSTSSALVSPALRPKISPSIKPLLPEGAVSDDTHALLLASKSNYQNILDGTTVPGVNYPTSLSTNLTSKRTSHKIAEQGRRNRINTALQEMQQLLPSPQIHARDARDAKSPDSSGGAQTNNSKAAKVESAIEYIKQLQKQCSEKDKLIDQKDLEMEALRRELAALRRSGSVGSSSNPAEIETQLKSESKSGSETENAT